MQSKSESQSNAFLPILIGGSLILMMGFAPRAGFGLFQIPVANELGWERETFSLAIAIQNLAWGFGQPIFGAIAERWGDRRAIFLGIAFYVLGLSLTSIAYSPFAMQSLEVLVGFGIAGMGFGVILAMIGRAASPKNRSLALGIATAAGSAGQIIGPPVIAALLGSYDWRSVFLILAGVMVLSALIVLLLPKQQADAKPKKGELREVLQQTFRDRNYHFIFFGFFSCGFQLGFITAHFPAMIQEFCGPISGSSALAGMGITTGTALSGFAMSVIGAFNIIGSILAGHLGRDWSKKYLLSSIYLGRTIIAAWFIVTPMTPSTVLVFSVVMGFLWLATVPLTSGLIGYIYGLKFMGTLYGIVFFSHQLGSFMGVWLGGVFYDHFGNYNIVWWVGVGVGLFSAIIHLPVVEKPNREMFAELEGA